MLISYAALDQVSLVADAAVHSFDVGGVADQSSAALDTSCHVSGVFSSGVHVSGVFSSVSHFLIARHVVDKSVAIIDVETLSLLAVAVVLNAVSICDALLNTTTAFDDALADGVIFDTASLTRTISELVVDVV
jgi:pyridoxal biosynthesis lyase PdxS